MEDLIRALDACFGVMMQPTLEQPKEGNTKLLFSVPYHHSVWINERGIAEKMYYEVIEKLRNETPK